MARARRRPAGGNRGYDRTDRLNSLLFRILAEELENWLRQHEFRVALGE